ncbi:MAG: hypothetical protein ACOCVU_06970 [Desulfohalobiaceae bacterium]
MKYFAVWGLALLLLAAGCQTMQVRTAGPEKELRERVAAYWAAKADNDPIATYPFYASGYREEVPLKTHVRRGNIAFSDWSLDSLEVLPSGEEAKVTIQADMQVMGLTFENATMTEKWVLEEGSWYLDAPTPKQSFQKLFSPSSPPAESKE